MIVGIGERKRNCCLGAIVANQLQQNVVSVEICACVAGFQCEECAAVGSWRVVARRHINIAVLGVYFPQGISAEIVLYQHYVAVVACSRIWSARHILAQQMSLRSSSIAGCVGI